MGSRGALRALRGAGDPAERARNAVQKLRELVASAEAGQGAAVRETLGFAEAENFVEMAAERGRVLFDARAPCEFDKGHVLGANNLALLDDEDRAKVGTRFKKAGRGPAIKLGFSLLEPKAQALLERAESLLDASDATSIAIYCARGGMRSQLTGWFLREALGKAVTDVTVCNGGYKAYRNLVLGCYENGPQPEVRIVGGRTGAGKTRLLQMLRDVHGQQVIDLEGLAEHKGSAFGRIGQRTSQPSSEHYGNLVGTQWRALDPSRPVYLEDEGPNVGDCQVPPALYAMMRASPLVLRIDVPDEQRISNLINDYCVADEDADPEAYAQWLDHMRDSATRVRRRLGDERLKAVLEGLRGRQYEEVARTLLSYYDRMYDHHLTKNRDKRDFIDVAMPVAEGFDSTQSESEAERYAALAGLTIEAAEARRSADEGKSHGRASEGQGKEPKLQGAMMSN